MSESTEDYSRRSRRSRTFELPEHHQRSVSPSRSRSPVFRRSVSPSRSRSPVFRRRSNSSLRRSRGPVVRSRSNSSLSQSRSPVIQSTITRRGPKRARVISPRNNTSTVKDPEDAHGMTNTNNNNGVLTLIEQDLFDCSICCEPLTIPVYQCGQNGHLACFSCSYIKRSVGYNRCHAMEKVLESITTSCINSKYGCRESVPIAEKTKHQKRCPHSPCACPFPNCGFVSSAKKLYRHFSHNAHFSTQFSYDQTFSVDLKAEDEFLVLQEKNDGTVFILENYRLDQNLGSAVSLSCIQPEFMEGFSFEVTAKTEDSSVRLQSLTKNTPSQHQASIDDAVPKKGFLSDFSDHGPLMMDICIFSKVNWVFSR